MADKEPGMQEILASIRRIISEDDGDFAAASPQRSSEARQDAAAAEADETAADAPEETPEQSAAAPESAGDTAPPAEDSSLLSAPVEGEAVRAFAELRKNVVVPRGEGVSLDALVRAALHPLLRQWLDAHLPGMIESLVREEIRRIAHKSDG